MLAIKKFMNVEGRTNYPWIKEEGKGLVFKKNTFLVIMHHLNNVLISTGLLFLFLFILFFAICNFGLYFIIVIVIKLEHGNFYCSWLNTNCLSIVTINPIAGRIQSRSYKAAKVQNLRHQQKTIVAMLKGKNW